MHPTTEIQRRPDGSIDTAHYARIGRALHGAAMRVSAASLARSIGGQMKLSGRRRRAPASNPHYGDSILNYATSHVTTPTPVDN